MSDIVIEASYIWTVEEFLAASEVNIRRQPSMRIILSGLRFVALVLAIVGGFWLAVGKEARWIGGYLLLIAASLAGGTSLFVRKRDLRQAFRKAGAMAQSDQKITFVIDESRIRKLTAGAESSWIWELVPSVIEAPGGYLIDHGGVGHWLPNHAFADERDRDDFADLAARRAVKFVSRVRRPEPAPFS